MVMDSKNFSPWKGPSTSGPTPIPANPLAKSLPAWQMEGKIPTTPSPTSTTQLGNNMWDKSGEKSETLSSTVTKEEKEVNEFSKPGYGNQTKQTTAPSQSTPPSDIPYSNGFQAIADMVKKGMVPPDVRNDIDDKPLDPDQQLEQGKRAAPPKPWLKSAQPSATVSAPQDANQKQES